MKNVTIRDFRSRPRKVQEELRREGEAVLTANGRPIALMIGVDENTFDDTVETLRRARGLEALRAIRRESGKLGLSKLSVKEIDAVISKVRRKRTRSRQG